MNLTELKLGERIHALFTGETGTRKTSSIAGFPGPIYILDCDNRIRALLKITDRKDIEFDSFGPNDYVRFTDKLDEVGRSNKYATIAVDSLTSITDMLLNYSYSLRGPKGSREGDRKNTGIIEVNTMEDYLLEKHGLEKAVDYLRAMQCNVILTAHLTAGVDEKVKGSDVLPARMIITGAKKIAARIPCYFDEIWNFAVKPNPIVGQPPSFVVNTIHTGIDYARTALRLPAQMDITNKPLYDYVKASLKDTK